MFHPTWVRSWQRLDTGWAWVVLAIGFGNLFVIGATSAAFGVLYVQLKTDFAFGSAETVLIYGMQWALCLFFGFIGQHLVHIFGCRGVILSGQLIAASGYVGSTFSSSLPHFYLTMSLLPGFGFSLAMLSSVVSVQYYFDRRRAMAAGVLYSGIGVSILVIPPITNAVTDAFGWRGMHLFLAAIMAFNGLAAMFIFPIEDHILAEIERLEFDDEEKLSSVFGSASLSTASSAETLAAVKKGADSPIAGLFPGSFNSNPATNVLSALSQATESSDDKRASDSLDEANNRQATLPVKTIGEYSKSMRDGRNSTDLALEAQMELHKEKQSLGNPVGNGWRKHSTVPSTKATTVTGTTSNRSRGLSKSEFYEAYVRRMSIVSVASFTGSFSYGHIVKKKYDEYVDRRGGSAEPDFVTLPTDHNRLERVVYRFFPRELLRSGPLWALIMTRFLAAGPASSVYSFIVSFAEQRGLSHGQASLVLSFSGLGGLISRPLAGMLCDRYELRPIYVTTVTLLLSSVVTLLTAADHAFPLFAVNFLLFGITTGAHTGLAVPAILDLIDLHQLPKFFGISTSFEGIASFIWPPVFGVILERTGSHIYIFVTCTILYFLAALASFYVLLAVRRKDKVEPAKLIDTPVPPDRLSAVTAEQGKF